MYSLLENSEIWKSHLDCDKVQDAYSFRCAPQVHGACRDLLAHVRNILTIEINSSTDNPLLNPETGEIESNGNFHGQPVAFALDILTMGLCELGSLSERRTAKLMDPLFSELPAFLVPESGLNSGLMMAHVTAASLVSENKLLSHPASTDSIPTNNEKEDHVSMGPLAARKAKTVLENTQYILAIEIISACQALEMRKPLRPGSGGTFLFKKVREAIAALKEDRYLTPDIEKITGWFRDSSLWLSANKEGLFDERNPSPPRGDNPMPGMGPGSRPAHAVQQPRSRSR
jgi:histidine ammonia-lyase